MSTEDFNSTGVNNTVHVQEPRKITISGEILSLWEQTVCEIRSEIKAQDTPALVYAKELCDKLEYSMCASAGNKQYTLKYKLMED